LPENRCVWDDSSGDFDCARTSATPQSLRGVFTREPLFLDFRKLRSTRLSFDDEEFLDRVALIAAPLHGKERDEIFGEHIRQHRPCDLLVGCVGIANTSCCGPLGNLLRLAAKELGRAFRTYQSLGSACR
jgi:hypothetical protein